MFICFIVFKVHIHTVYTRLTHFCRELNLVAIKRFLGGTFCQNLVGGGTKTFYTAGPDSVTSNFYNEDMAENEGSIV